LSERAVGASPEASQRSDLLTGQRATVQVERIHWEGRTVTATWQPPPFRPSRRLTTQALGLCFTDDGQIVLVTNDGANWTLPGGHPESGETLEATLVREVSEEACARVVESVYIGCQRVDDPQRTDGPALYYQARFWARVELDPFVQRHETSARRLVAPDDFLNGLAWGFAASARIILDEGLRIERQHTAESTESE
jgi:ADP-ribose pyrophosphatase YjhB (NUDIX family)